MGILNVTPDSFSDGGRYVDVSAAIQRAREMVTEGADIIDIGGESTRPGARPVTLDQELERVIPVVRRLAADVSVPLSVDTSRPEIMKAAAEAGAGMINDVRALREPGAMSTAVELQLPICLMHMQGEPATMQDDPYYENVVREVHAFLSERLTRCRKAGISRTMMLVDPGFGFGKTPEHNRQVLESLDSYLDLGAPLIVGLSRKSFSDHRTEKKERDRVSTAHALLAVRKGAAMVRVHDVGLTVKSVRDWEERSGEAVRRAYAREVIRA